MELVDNISNRISIFKSNKDVKLDKTHHITYFRRDDIIDYSKGDYVSLRLIEGVNNSDSDSYYLDYSESSDVRCYAKDIIIRAVDSVSKKDLKVEFFNTKDKLYKHDFKIYFEEPIKSGEEFAIIFLIFIPNELKYIDDKDEIMSVSLKRFSLGVDELSFNLFLSEENVSADVYSLTNNRVINEDIALEQNKVYFKPEDIDAIFTSLVGTVHVRNVISLNVKNPKNELYIINYKF